MGCGCGKKKAKVRRSFTSRKNKKVQKKSEKSDK